MKRLPFRTKLVLLFVVLTAVFMTISSSIGYVVSKRIILENIRVANENKLMLGVKSMQNLVEQSREEYQLFVNDLKVPGDVNPEDSIGLIEEAGDLNPDFHLFLYFHREFAGIYLYQDGALIGSNLDSDLQTRDNPAAIGKKPPAPADVIGMLVRHGQFKEQELHAENILTAPVNGDAYIVAVLNLKMLEQMNHLSLTQINPAHELVYSDSPIDAAVRKETDQATTATQSILTRQVKGQIVTSYRTEKGELFILDRDLQGTLADFHHILRQAGLAMLVLLALSAALSAWMAGRIVRPFYDFMARLRALGGQPEPQEMDEFAALYRQSPPLSRQVFRYCLLMFVPVLLISAVSLNAFQHVTDATIQQDDMAIFNKSAGNFDNRLQNVISSARLLSIEPHFQDLMMQADQQQSVSDAAFSDLLVGRGFMNKNIRFVHIFDNQGREIYSSDHTADPDFAGDGQAKSPVTDHIELVKNDSDFLQPTIVLTKEVRISSRDQLHPLFDYMGYLEIGVQNLFELPADIGGNKPYSIVLMDAQERIFLLTGDFGAQTVASVSRLVRKLQPASHSDVPMVQDGLLAAFVPVDSGNWQMGFFVPRDTGKQTYLFILLYMLETIAMLLIIVATSSYMSRRLTGSIRRVIHVMDAYPDDLASRLTGLPEDEFEFVIMARSFNRMLARLEQLTQQLRVKQSENDALDRRVNRLLLRALQSQVNPHFLHNLFTSIVFLLKSGQIRKAERMLIETARFLKTGLYGTKDLIPLSEELEHVQRYLNIQTIRHEARLQTYLEVDPACARCRVLKFLIQPLVENAVHHAMPKERLLTIRIDCRKREDGHLSIRVLDDGNGLTREEVAELGRRLRLRQQSDHYGMSNVHERIHLEFGEPFGLQLESEPGQGTTVTMLLPFIEEEGEDGNAAV